LKVWNLLEHYCTQVGTENFPTTTTTFRVHPLTVAPKNKRRLNHNGNSLHKGGFQLSTMCNVSKLQVVEIHPQVLLCEPLKCGLKVTGLVFSVKSCISVSILKYFKSVWHG